MTSLLSIDREPLDREPIAAEALDREPVVAVAADIELPDAAAEEHPPPARPELPVGYYLANFELLLETVVARDGWLLAPAERAFYVELAALPLAARRLYVRLLTRRGPLVRRDRLAYAEIADLDQALAALAAAGFVDDGADEPLAVRLALLRREEAIAIAGTLAVEPAADGAIATPSPFARWRRCDLLTWLTARAAAAQPPAAELAARLASRHPAVRALRLHEVTVFRLLFFGNLRQDLVEWVLRDLGVMRYAPYPLAADARPFPDRRAVEDALAARQLAGQVERWLVAGDQERAAAAAELVAGRAAEPGGWHPLARRHADRVLVAVGRERERAGDLEGALALYVRAERSPARERRARVLERMGRHQEAAELAVEMVAAPRDEVEAELGPRLLARLQRARASQGAASGPVRAAAAPGARAARGSGGFEVEELVVAAGDESIERRTLAALAAVGRPGFHGENWLWRAAFGLAFWDVVFADVPDAFVQPFQLGPLDLEEPEFRVRRAGLVADRLASVAATGDLAARLLPIYDAHSGVANRLVPWGESIRERLALALGRLHGAELAAVCDRLAHNLGRFALGLPDLFVLEGEDRFSLLEVKGPGDQLRPEQRGWLRYLGAAGLPARVLRVQIAVAEGGRCR